MAVRIRLKKMGRAHRPFFRICAVDQRSPRDGRVIEELGLYDPMCPETDARALLKGDRIDYWVGVGAQPSDKVKVLIKKYGTSGTHLEQQKAALERLTQGLAVEYQAQGISANVLSPVGRVRTPGNVFGMTPPGGTPEPFEKAEAMGKAAVFIVTQPPQSFTGNILFDEEMVRQYQL